MYSFCNPSSSLEATGTGSLVQFTQLFQLTLQTISLLRKDTEWFWANHGKSQCFILSPDVFRRCWSFGWFLCKKWITWDSNKKRKCHLIDHLLLLEPWTNTCFNQWEPTPAGTNGKWRAQIHVNQAKLPEVGGCHEWTRDTQGVRHLPSVYPFHHDCDWTPQLVPYRKEACPACRYRTKRLCLILCVVLCTYHVLECSFSQSSDNFFSCEDSHAVNIE